MEKMIRFAFLFGFMNIILLGNTTADESSDVKGIIGAILDSSSRIGQEQAVALKMALEDFYHYSNQSYNLYIRNSEGDPLQAALAARDLIDKQKVQAIIGPQTWDQMSLVAEVCSQKSIPLLSLADATPQWALEKWHFLLQASPSQIMQMKAIAEIVKSWKPYKVSIIYEDGDSSSLEVLSQLSGALKEVGTELSNVLSIPPLVSSSSLSQELEKLREGQCAVFIVHLSFPLALHLFETAKKMNMMGEGKVWITTGTFTSLVHSMNASTISNMQGIIGVKSYILNQMHQYENFYQRFRKNFGLENFEEFNYEPGIFAAQTYDAAWTVAKAMIETNQKGGQLLLDKILHSDFTGLSGKIQFTDHKIAPANTFQIINVIGKSYREIGFWLDGHGFSKTFGQNDSYSPSVKELGRVVNPTCTKRLRIGVPSTSTFKQYVNVIQNNSENVTSFKGFAIDLFKEVVKELPYHLEYDFFAFDGTYDEMVEQIYFKTYDAVVGDVTIVSTRYEYASFTQPYTNPGVMMIVPVKSKEGNKMWLFMKPFTKLMWILILAIIAYNGFVIWIIERNHRPELKGPILHQTTTILWLAFISLFSLNGDKLHSNLSRVAMVVWLFVALIITQTYTASLASMLTVERFEPTIDSLQQLKNSNAKVGYDQGSYLQRYLQDALDFSAENIKQFDSQHDYADALGRKEIAAAFLDAAEAKIFLTKYCKGFVQVGPTHKIGGYGFVLLQQFFYFSLYEFLALNHSQVYVNPVALSMQVFPKGSPLLDDVNEVLLNISESGTLRDLENSMLASEECKDTEPGSETTSLSPCSFLVLFILTVGTSTTALLIYIFHVNYLCHGHRTVWSLMMAVIKSWGSQKRLFSRRVHNFAEYPLNSPNISTLA
ncbi:Solute-binding protein family 3/N-terminal domain of MltF [Sesbania bispinosa]|nr:Solute-binding protein family 3/N-terminal domain of MltF [Sesbania bispinosa]